MTNSELDDSLVYYSYDMMERSEEYDITPSVYLSVVSQKDLPLEVEESIESKYGDIVCDGCGQDRLFNTKQNAFYCPVCE